MESLFVFISATKSHSFFLRGPGHQSHLPRDQDRLILLLPNYELAGCNRRLHCGRDERKELISQLQHACCMEVIFAEDDRPVLGSKGATPPYQVFR